jgi:hypothetical protein
MKLWNWADGLMSGVKHRRAISRRRARGSITVEVCEARILPAITTTGDTLNCSHAYNNSMDVGANDSAYGQEYRIKTQGTKGTAEINGGIFVYNAGHVLGQDTVIYETWDDSAQVWVPGTVTVNVTNEAPVGHIDIGVTEFASPKTFSISDLTSNDTDADGNDKDYLVISDVGFESNGVATIDTYDGSVTFTPTYGFVGNASFYYKARDLQGAKTGWTKVTVNVSPSDFKYGTSVFTGHPGNTVTRDGSGEVDLYFFGYGPLNKTYALETWACLNGVQIAPNTMGSFTTSSSNGAWAQDAINWSLPPGAVIYYQILEYIGPNWTPVSGTLGTTTVV